MTDALEDRIHAGRELVEEDDRRIDHEHLRDLDAPAEAAAQVLRLPSRLSARGRSAPSRRRRSLAPPASARVKPREREQVVAHRQQQLRGVFLDHDGDPLRGPRAGSHDVVAEHAPSRTSAAQRRQDASVVVLPAPFGPSSPKIAPRFTLEAQTSIARPVPALPLRRGGKPCTS